ncbi:MAG: hypothetical protein AB7E81_01190 [Hyphomicrobiaceae bacterium]
MASAIMEARLRAAFLRDIALTDRGIATRFEDPSGVAVAFGQSEAGIWRWQNGQFELFVAGDGPVAAFDTVAEAVRYTRDRLGK